MDIEGILSHLLSRGKIRKAALLTTCGKVLAISKHCDLSAEDINTILHCLSSGLSSHGMVNVDLANEVFTCMPYGLCDRPSGVLVGRADDNMFVAIKTKRFVLVGFSDVVSPGSCIYEISEMGRFLELREL